MNYRHQLSLTALLALEAAALAGCSQAPSETRTVGQLAVEQAGEALEGSGACATLMQLDGDCPGELEWDNHGQYVSCVAKYLSARVDSGDVSEEERDELVSAAAQSDIGLPARSPAAGAPGLGGAPGEAGLDRARERVCP